MGSSPRRDQLILTEVQPDRLRFSDELTRISVQDLSAMCKRKIPVHLSHKLSLTSEGLVPKFIGSFQDKSVDTSTKEKHILRFFGKEDRRQVRVPTLQCTHWLEKTWRV